MGIVRRKSFSSTKDFSKTEIDLIDTPEKLIRFAENRNISICPLDVETLAKELSITVSFVTLDEEISGILIKDENKGWMILVNKNHSSNRQRYTIAHELAHFCLHRHLAKNFEDRVFFRGTETNKAEWDANAFAGAILVPENELKKALDLGVNEIEALAEKFQISSLALRVRAKQLHMSGHGL